MDTEESPPSAGSFAQLFRPAPLPRWRAVFSITCAAAAFLSAGGMLEYGTGSPETHGTAAATYWALVFGLHVVAFGGAGLLAAFPGLARLPVKGAWLVLITAVYGWAFAVWRAHEPAATLADWLARSSGYVPGAVAVLIALLLPATSGMPPEADS